MASSPSAPSVPVPTEPTLDQIRQTLRLQNAALVAEVTTQVKAVVADETARHARLDMKANTLLGVVGLLVAIVTALVPRTSGGVGRVLLLVAAACALASVGCAVRALFVTAYARVPDAAIFSPKVLGDADDLDEPADGVALYQRFLLASLWEVHQSACKVNDRKARAVRYGQGLFAAAIFVGTIAAMVASP